MDSPEFLTAMKNQDLATLDRLLSSPRYDFNRTLCMYYACQHGHYHVVDHLLRQGESPSWEDSRPLREASFYGNVNIVKLLLPLPGVDPSARGNEALREASRNGHVEVVRLLLSLPLSRGVNPSANNNEALRMASRNGHVEVVRLLADQGVNLDHDPLILATSKGHTEVLRLLIERGVNPSAHNNQPLKMACQEGYVDIVKLLLDLSVDPSVNDNYPLRVASERGHADVVTLLLTDPRVDPTVNNNYPLQVASDRGYPDVVKLVLTDSRVDPMVNGNYPLNRAIIKGQLEVVKLLLPRVDPSYDDNHSIWLALTKEKYDIARLLLADRRVDRDRSLLWAVRFNLLTGAELLLGEYQVSVAPVEVKDLRRFLRLAGKRKNHRLVTLLLHQAPVLLSLCDHPLQPFQRINQRLRALRQSYLGQLIDVRQILASPLSLKQLVVIKLLNWSIPLPHN